MVILQQYHIYRHLDIWINTSVYLTDSDYFRFCQPWILRQLAVILVLRRSKVKLNFKFRQRNYQKTNIHFFYPKINSTMWEWHSAVLCRPGCHSGLGDGQPFSSGQGNDVQLFCRQLHGPGAGSCTGKQPSQEAVLSVVVLKYKNKDPHICDL